MLNILEELLIGGGTGLLCLWTVTWVASLLRDDRHQRTMRNIAELERELFPDLPKALRWYDDGGDKFVAVKDPTLIYDRDEGYIYNGTGWDGQADYIEVKPGALRREPLSQIPVYESFYNGAKVLSRDHPYSIQIEDSPGVYYGKITMGV